MIDKHTILNNIEVHPDTLCWKWKGAVTKLGYGRCEKQYVHRASYSIFKGEIKEGMCVCHKCDNPSCINPDHLFLGTHKDNTHDCIRKGRFTLFQFKGPNTSGAKLDENDVLQILEELNKGKTQSSLAKKYNVSFSTIYSIKHGRRWSYLTNIKPKTPRRDFVPRSEKW